MTRLALAFFLFLPTAALGQGDEKPSGADSGKPGAEHEFLKGFVGKWELTVEGGQGKGTAEFKSIMGGRFITEEAKLPFGGVSMDWMGIYGYDTHKKKYTAVWVDNLDTNTELGEADADVAGKVLNFRGQHPDPRTGKQANFIWRMSREGDKKLTIEMFEVDGAGKQNKVLSIRGEKMK